MVLWILFGLFFLLILGFLLFRIRNKRSHNLLKDSTILMARQKLDELNRHGEQIRKLQHSQQYSRTPNHVSQRDSIPKRNLAEERAVPAIRREQLPRDIVELQETIINILVGKYHLDPETQVYISQKLDEMFSRLLGNMTSGSLQHRVGKIRAQYDPMHSNELLLQSCRFLMNYENLSPSVRLRVAQFIVNTTSDGEELGRVYDWIIELGSDETASQQVRQEAVDMLILSNSSRYRTIATLILESLRRVDDVPQMQIPDEEDGFPFNIPIRQIQVERPVPGRDRRQTIRLGGIDYDIGEQRRILDRFQATLPKTDRTVYQDGQSVHNNEINKSVIQAAKSLQAQYPVKSRLNFDTSLLKDLPSVQRQKAETALHRIATDDAAFGEGITLSNLFQSLQSFILSSPDKDELNKRLIQELGDMSGTCASGHLSRLVNVVQGFNAIPQQAIRIKLGDEIYATVNHTLTQALTKPENQEVSEAVIMGENQKLVNNFVAQKLNTLLPEMQKAYQGTAKDDEIIKELLSAAEKYTKNKHFTIHQNKIVAN